MGCAPGSREPRSASSAFFLSASSAFFFFFPPSGSVFLAGADLVYIGLEIDS